MRSERAHERRGPGSTGGAKRLGSSHRRAPSVSAHQQLKRVAGASRHEFERSQPKDAPLEAVGHLPLKGSSLLWRVATHHLIY